MAGILSKIESWRQKLSNITASRPWIVPGILLLAFAAMATQMFVRIDRYAVNILFSDQWDTYQPLFRGDNIWQIFTAQVGQLRLGVGGLLSAAVAGATGWNTRGESFFIGTTMVAIAALAIYLKHRLFGRFTLWDSLIPMICLSVSLTDVPIFVPFPSHSTVPVLLLIIYAICLTVEYSPIRFVGLAIVNFLAIFTGWGLFIGFITPFVLGYLLNFGNRTGEKRIKIWAAFTLVFSIFSLGYYFYDYVIFPGVDCFTFPHYPLTDYAWFASLMLSNSVGFACGRAIVFSKFLGTLLIFILALVFSLSVWKLLREKGSNTKYLVIAVLLSFTIIFGLSSTFGRVCLGECTAASGRYQQLLVPAWLGIYFAVILVNKDNLRLILSVLLLIFCFIVPEAKNKSYRATAEYSRNFKLKWKACYLEKENADLCDKETGISIFSPIPSAKAQDRINYLKERHLNFFSEN